MKKRRDGEEKQVFFTIGNCQNNYFFNKNYPLDNFEQTLQVFVPVQF